MKTEMIKTNNKKNFKFFAVVFLMVIGTIKIVAQPLVVDGGNSRTICSGATTALGGSPTANYGTAPYTYSWVPAANLSSATVSNPNATLTTTTTYTLTVTDAVSAVSTATLTVSVDPGPIVDAGPDQTFCLGNSTTFSPSVTGGISYMWNFGDGGTSTAYSPTYTYSAPGIYTATLTATNSSGCTSNDAVLITINPTPIVTANSATICIGQSATITAAGANTYYWTPSATLSSAFVSSPTASPTITTTYTVTGTSAAGCMGTAVSTVTVLPLPVVNAGLDQTVCIGNPITFSGSATGAVTYSWDFGDSGTSTVLNPSHTYTTAGTYTVALAATSSSGCSATDNANIVVAPLPVLTTTSSNINCYSFCNGTATVTVTSGAAPYTYLWDDAGSQTTSTATSLCAGNYSATVTDANGCSSISGTAVTQPSMVSITTTSVSITCNGACNGSATVSVTGGVAPYTYSWAPGGSITSSITGLCAGMYTVNVTDANGCSQAKGVLVSEPAPLTVSTSPKQTICSGTSASIFAVPSGGTWPYTYVWNNGATNFDTLSNTTVNPTTSIVYIATVTDASGCTASRNDTVFVLPKTNIIGHVSYTGGSLSSGVNKVVLFKYLSVLSSFDTLTVTTLDGSGNYTFTSVNQGDYLIKVFPDTSIYHSMVPTYYGNKYLWDSAKVILHGCNAADTANITMVEGLTGVGPGFLHGNISEDFGFGRAPGDPVPGIDIKLGRNPGGQLFANTVTDGSGDYTFDNIPVGSYIIFVDIPGLGRDSTYIVNVTLTNNQFTNLDYNVDSTMIHPVLNSGVGIKHVTIEENKFSVYPNPAKGAATIEYTVASDTKVILEVYNVLGVKVLNLLNNKQSAGTYKYTVDSKNHNLNSGIYFIKLVKDGKVSTQRLVITE